MITPRQPATDEQLPRLPVFAWAVSMLTASKHWAKPEFAAFVDVSARVLETQQEVLRDVVEAHQGAMRAVRAIEGAVDVGHGTTFAQDLLNGASEVASEFSGLFAFLRQNGDLGTAKTRAAIAQMGYAVDSDLRQSGQRQAAVAADDIRDCGDVVGAVARQLRDLQRHSHAADKAVRDGANSSSVYYLALVIISRDPDVEDIAAEVDSGSVADSVVRAVERDQVAKGPVRASDEGDETPASEVVRGARLATMSALMHASADILGHAEWTELPFDPEAVGAPRNFEVLASRMAALTHRAIAALEHLSDKPVDAAFVDSGPLFEPEGLTLGDRARLEGLAPVVLALERVVEQISVVYAEVRKRGSAFVPERLDSRRFVTGDPAAGAAGWLQSAIVANASNFATRLRIVRAFATALPPARQ